jgi:signal transduction histidine kinase
MIQWFAPPSLESSEAERRARGLWLVAWPFLAVVTVTLGIAVAVEPETLARRAVTVAAVAILITILHEINRRGRTSLASWLFVIGCTVIVTQRAWITGGVHAPVAVFYALFILMAGGLLGTGAGLVTALTCLAGSMLLTAAELLGALAPPAGTKSPVAAFVFVVLAIGLAVVIQYRLAPPGGRTLDPIRRDLVQMFVHDMRTPLMLLGAHLGTAREESRTEAAPAIDEAIGTAHTLNRLVDNLLDLGRLEEGRMPFAPRRADVTAIADEVAAAMRPLALGDVEVLGWPAVCRCDPDLLRRVIENLVSNAIKHTATAQPIRVQVTRAPGTIRVAVSDQGPGVPEADRGRIFERFSSSAMTTGEYPSTGLGLAFCKLAVELHGGTIRVENATPRGSVFVIELPD